VEGDVALAVDHHHAVEFISPGLNAQAATEAKVGTTLRGRGVGCSLR
jgi:hypothetical protein